MEQQVKLHKFAKSDEWETVDTYWSSPFYYWKRHGVRVSPPVPVRVKAFGRVVAESYEGWTNIGGASSMLVQSIQIRGEVGQTVRIEVGEEIIVDEDEDDDER